MADNPLNQALSNLETTIGTITNKVEQNKQRVRDYKTQIINKLREVIEQLNQLKENNNLKSIPQLRQQLEQSQNILRDKTAELEETKTNLENATRSLQESENNIRQLTSQIEDLNRQIQQLTESNQQKDGQLRNLNDQLTQLTQQKTEAERKLAASQQEIEGLVQRIAQINTSLANQIELIDQITNELGNISDDNDDIAIQFKAVGDNIMAIMNMINNPGSGGAEAAVEQIVYDIDSNFNNLMALHSLDDKRQFLRYIRSLDGRLQNQINQVINNAERKIPTDVQTLKKILSDNKLKVNPPSINGGKRRHRTMKKRHRRTRKKMRGGYVYSASKELDKASSIVSKSSSSKSKSKFKSQNKDKTRRKSMK
jgi:predicted  nucleic acid-binding Zn-ribbon protein